MCTYRLGRQAEGQLAHRRQHWRGRFAILQDDMFIIYPLSHESIIFSFDYNFPGDGPKILLLLPASFIWLVNQEITMRSKAFLKKFEVRISIFKTYWFLKLSIFFRMKLRTYISCNEVQSLYEVRSFEFPFSKNMNF